MPSEFSRNPRSPGPIVAGLIGLVLALWSIAGCKIADPRSGALICTSTDECEAPRTCELGYCVLFDRDAGGVNGDAGGSNGDASVPEPPSSILPETPITEGPDEGAEPAIAWSGTAALIAWQDSRGTDKEIYYRLLNAQGEKIGGEIALTSDDGLKSEKASVAWTGQEFVIAWHDDRNGNRDVFAAVVSEAGLKVGQDIAVSTDLGEDKDPWIVAAGGKVGVAWESNRHGAAEVYFAVVEDAAVSVSPLRISNQAGQSKRPSIASLPSGWAVGWDDTTPGNEEAFLQMIDSGGSPMGGATRLSDDAAKDHRSALSSSGGTLLMAWQNDANNRSVAISLDGALELKTIEGFERPANAGSDNSFGFVYEQAGMPKQVFFSEASLEGDSNQPIQLTTTAGNSERPTLVWAGDRFIVTWHDARSGTKAIFAKVLVR